MKIICDVLDLTDALSKVTRALPTKVMIGLNNDGIKISAHGDTVVFTANDMEYEIENTIKAVVQEEGDVLVPGKYMYEIVKRIESGCQVDIYSIEEDVIHIKAMDNTAHLSKFRLEDFVPLSNADEEYDISFNIPQKDLKRLVEKTSFSAATDDSRPQFKGCLFDIKGNNMNVVALDGYRMAVASYALPAEYDSIQAVVPVKTLNEVAKLMENEEESVTLYFSSKRFSVSIGEHTKVTSNLLSGKFLDYARTIPTSYETKLTVNIKQLQASLDRAAVMTRYDKSSMVKVEVKDSIMNVLASSSIGEINDMIKIYSKGKDVTMLLNCKFILDVLKNCDGEFVNISLNSPTAPFIIEPINESENEKYVYLLLPIRY